MPQPTDAISAGNGCIGLRHSWAGGSIPLNVSLNCAGTACGCVGYFSAAGEFDSCIVLRTALIKDGTMYVQAGAGIVADSDPRLEQAECINKAKALFRAAEEARRFASAAGRGQ